KSENGGTTWEPIFDTYGAASIGDVKIFQKDKNLIWVGTGEGHQRNTAAWGDGIYKSTDGGDHFENIGLKDTYNIGRIRLHPTNKDIAYVAALGNIWAPIGSRGLFKTIDGGKNWTKLTTGLPNSPMSGADGLVMDPSNPEILYVSFWDRIRYPWGLISGGNSQGVPDPQKIVDGSKNGGIFKSIDGGKTWKKLTVGLPPVVGRIGLAIAKTNPKILMAHVEAEVQPECGGGGGRRARRRRWWRRRTWSRRRSGGGWCSGGRCRCRRRRRSPRRRRCSSGGAGVTGEHRLHRHDEARRGDVPLGGRGADVEAARSLHQPAVLLHASADEPAE